MDYSIAELMLGYNGLVLYAYSVRSMCHKSSATEQQEVKQCIELQ